MSIKTKIEWCDSTVNPAPCCTGCELYPDYCYAARMIKRYAGKPGWSKSFTTPTLFSDRVVDAAHWPDLTGKKRPDKPWLDGRPRMIFLNDMGDPFAPLDNFNWKPSSHWLHKPLRIIEHSPHIWMLLTKWPARFVEFAERYGPLPRNLWGGVSVTSQDTAWRIEELLGIDLAVRFISAEPLLWPLQPFAGTYPNEINWVIVGGETGPGARPMHPDNVRWVRDQCAALDVPFFFKSWGEWQVGNYASPSGLHIDIYGNDVTYQEPEKRRQASAAFMVRVGKKSAGRLLDGREHNELPTHAKE